MQARKLVLGFAILLGTVALADTLYKQGTTVLGPVNIVQCGDGITCTRDGGQVTVQSGVQYWFDAGVGASSRYPNLQTPAPLTWIYSPSGISLPDGGATWFDSQSPFNPWAAGSGSPANPPLDVISIGKTATAGATGDGLTGNVSTPSIGFWASLSATQLGKFFGANQQHVTVVSTPGGGTVNNPYSMHKDGGAFTWSNSLGFGDGGTPGFDHGLNFWPLGNSRAITFLNTSGSDWASQGTGSWGVAIGSTTGTDSSIADSTRSSIMRVNARPGGDAISFTAPYTYLHLGAGARIWSASIYCPEPGTCTRPAGYSGAYSTPVITMAPAVSIPVLSVGRLYVGTAPYWYDDGGLHPGGSGSQVRTTWVSDGGTVAAQSSRLEWIGNDGGIIPEGSSCVANSELPQTVGIIHTCDVYDAGYVTFTFHNYTSGPLTPVVGTYSALTIAP